MKRKKVKMYPLTKMKRISDSPCMHTNLNKYLGNFQPIRQSGCKFGLRKLKFKKTYDSVEFLEMGRDRNQETLAISWPQLYTRPQQSRAAPGSGGDPRAAHAAQAAPRPRSEGASDEFSKRERQEEKRRSSVSSSDTVNLVLVSPAAF